MICCDACGTAVPAYDVVSYGSIEQGYRDLCNCCFNAEVASALGLERFGNVRLHPVLMTDCAGERHEFHFRMRLLGSMVALDAFELRSRCAGGISVPDTRETGRRTIVAARPPGRADAPKSVRQASRAQRARHADCRPADELRGLAVPRPRSTLFFSQNREILQEKQGGNRARIGNYRGRLAVLADF